MVEAIRQQCALEPVCSIPGDPSSLTGESRISVFWTFLLIAAPLSMAFFPRYIQDGFLARVNPPTELRRLTITGAIEFDLIGALAPVFFALLVIAVILWGNSVPVRDHLKILGLAVVSSLLAHVFAGVMYGSTSGTVDILYGLHAWLVSAAVFLVMSFRRDPTQDLSEHIWRVETDDLPVLFGLGFSYSVLSAFVLDLMSIPGSVWFYVGAAGTVDGILLSGLFVFLSLTNLVALANCGLFTGEAKGSQSVF
jgi:hypothetical protein